VTFDDDTLEGDTQNFRMNNAVSWAADQSFIVYSRNKDVWKLTPDGLNPEALTNSHDCISPSVSRDNRLVYVKNERADTSNLYMKDLGTMNQMKPSFSPDGSRIVYTVTDGENVDIYMLTVSNLIPDQMTFDGKSHSPSFSHDGSKIIFASFVNDKYQPDIWIMNLDKSEKIKLTKDGGVSPVWLFRILSEPMPTPVPENAAPEAAPALPEPTQFVPPAEGTPPVIETPPVAPMQVEGELAVKLIKDGNKLMFYPVIHFDVGLANIKSEFYPVLDDMVKVISKYSSPVVIEGHTDNSPINTKLYPDNTALSKARANAVKKYLATKGILSKRMSVEGFGESRPIAPNDTEENKYRNRRAEIRIVLITEEEAKADQEVATPTPAVTETPTPEPTATPTPKPKNIIEKIFKPKKKTRSAGW
jgi:flagellar motor protein MotB